MTDTDVVTGALDTVNIDPEQLEAIGITHQRETTIGFQRSGEPVQYALGEPSSAPGRSIGRLRD